MLSNRIDASQMVNPQNYSADFGGIMDGIKDIGSSVSQLGGIKKMREEMESNANIKQDAYNQFEGLFDAMASDDQALKVYNEQHGTNLDQDAFRETLMAELPKYAYDKTSDPMEYAQMTGRLLMGFMENNPKMDLKTYAYMASMTNTTNNQTFANSVREARDSKINTDFHTSVAEGKYKTMGDADAAALKHKAQLTEAELAKYGDNAKVRVRKALSTRPFTVGGGKPMLLKDMTYSQLIENRLDIVSGMDEFVNNDDGDGTVAYAHTELDNIIATKRAEFVAENGKLIQQNKANIERQIANGKSIDEVKADLKLVATNTAENLKVLMANHPENTPYTSAIKKATIAADDAAFTYQSYLKDNIAKNGGPSAVKSDGNKMVAPGMGLDAMNGLLGNPKQSGLKKMKIDTFEILPNTVTGGLTELEAKALHDGLTYRMVSKPGGETYIAVMSNAQGDNKLIGKVDSNGDFQTHKDYESVIGSKFSVGDKEINNTPEKQIENIVGKVERMTGKQVNTSKNKPIDATQGKPVDTTKEVEVQKTPTVEVDRIIPIPEGTIGGVTSFTYDVASGTYTLIGKNGKTIVKKLGDVDYDKLRAKLEGFNK